MLHSIETRGCNGAECSLLSAVCISLRFRFVTLRGQINDQTWQDNFILGKWAESSASYCVIGLENEFFCLFSSLLELIIIEERKRVDLCAGSHKPINSCLWFDRKCKIRFFSGSVDIWYMLHTSFILSVSVTVEDPSHFLWECPVEKHHRGDWKKKHENWRHATVDLMCFFYLEEHLKVSIH